MSVFGPGKIIVDTDAGAAPEATFRKRRFRFFRRPWLNLGIVLCLCWLGVGTGALVWGNLAHEAATEALLDEDWAEARRSIDRTLWIWPGRPAVHLLAARICRLSDDFPGAERHLDECKRLLGGEANAALQLEWVLFRAQTGEADNVVAGLQQSLNEHPLEKGAIFEALARGYLTEARFVHARKVLEEWLKLERDNPKALTLRGLLWEYLQLADLCQKDLERALEIRPSLRTARLYLVDILIFNNNAPEAMRNLEILAKKNPDDRQVKLGLARCQGLLGHAEQARQILDQILADSPADAGALAYRAKVAFQIEPADQAEDWLRRAIGHNPGDKELRYNLYLALNKSGQKQKAAQALADYSRISKDVDQLDILLTRKWDRNPTDPQVPAEIGELYLRVGQAKFALHWLHLALKRDPKYQPAHRLLSEYYASVNDSAKAEFHRRRAN
jgi:Tfp pilus assembly protein PilF